MTRPLTSLLAIMAVFATFNIAGCDYRTIYDTDDDDASSDESDDTDLPDGSVDDDDASDDLPGGPSDDDASDDDDATDPDLPDGPDDDDATDEPIADDDDTVSDDDDSLSSDDDDATEPPLPGDDDDSATEPPADADGDGYTEDVDCDDSDPAIHPGASEACNGLDDNCNGVVPPNDVDADADGVLECAGDCDDNVSLIYPGAPELCGDGVDNDCDGAVNEGCPPAWCPTGTVVNLVTNGGFEASEVFENWPLPGEGWGFEVSSMPTRVCSTSPVEPYEGSCYARLTGNSNGSQQWYMEQLQVVVDTQEVGLQSGDMILFSMAYRSTTAFEPLLQFVDDLNVEDGLIAGGAWLEPPSSEDVWSTYSFGPASFMGNGNEWMRILLAYGDLATGEHVYADDVTVEACLSP